MILNEKVKGTWKRTFSIFGKIKIPWHLYILEIVLGVLSAKISLMAVPYKTSLKQGNILDDGMLLGYVGIMLLNFAVMIISFIPSIYSSGIIARNLRNTVVGKILHLPMKAYEQEKPSTLVSRVTVDSSSAGNILGSISSFITGVVTGYLVIEKMEDYQPELMKIIVCLGVYALFCYWLQGKLGFLINKRAKRAMGHMTAHFAEHTSFLKHVKLKAAEDAELKAGKKAIDEMYHTSLFNLIFDTISDFLSDSMIDIMDIIIFVIGAGMVRADVLTIDELVAFEAYAYRFIYSVEDIPRLYISIMNANGNLFYVGKLLDAEEEKNDFELSFDRKDEDIVFDHVDFAYEDQKVLSDVSFTIPKGKVTALVGENGSGKSTIFKLMERFYEPTSGTIKFNDTDVSKIDLSEWRQSFGYVLQDTIMIQGTIRENILFGVDREVKEEELIYAAKVADAYDFIMDLPGGFDYDMGEDGNRLSAGQKQRIAIARTVMVDPSYLLLDEATSNMDIYSEKSVNNALKNLMEGRTTVVITHHLKTIEEADNIIVIDEGKIAAQGTHEDLMKKSSEYRELIEAEKANFEFEEIA